MALRNQPYIPLYVQDYLTDEKLRECKAESVGVFSFLLCVMHKSDEYGTILLKQKDKQTSNQIKNFAIKLVKHLPYTIDIIESALIDLINEKVLLIEEDKLLQKRMIQDNYISEIRSKAGSKGGKKTQFAKAKDKANSENEIEYENEVENVIINNGIDFEVFWAAYDKKVGDKKKLKKKWEKLKEEERDKILKHIELYKQSQPDKQYRKNPETYLNNKSWNDEIIFKAKDGTTKPVVTENQLKGFSESILNDDRFK